MFILQGILLLMYVHINIMNTLTYTTRRFFILLTVLTRDNKDCLLPLVSDDKNTYLGKNAIHDTIFILLKIIWNFSDLLPHSEHRNFNAKNIMNSLKHQTTNQTN